VARARGGAAQREGVVIGDPYRSAPRDDRAEAPRDPGIVGDIIAQFADPLAFYRELVQNAIDAGSPAVDVKLAYDTGAGVMRASVRDRGEGMTRDILENQLLVLFRSTKEKDSSKIGKFGIGFASVLAPNPEVVAVQTSRDGRRLVLHLSRDLTYQIFDGGPATQTGTIVELDLAMPGDELADFAKRSREALVRWCRHASVPIHLAIELPDQPATTERIDRPLGLDEEPLVEVRGRSADGKLAAVVGLVAGGRPYVGFFNHGLMLHETREPLLGGIAAKVQDSRLGHTLSRDDVRRDAHFERALGFADDLADRELPVATAAALRAAAESDPARWQTLVDAIEAAKLELPARAWSFPLVAPHADRRWIAGDALGRSGWIAQRASALTAALGKPVIAGGRALAQLVHTVTGCDLQEVEAELTLIEPWAPTDEDTALIAMLAADLGAAHRMPEIVVARLAGIYSDALAISAPVGVELPCVVDRAQAAASPFGRKRTTLVLSELHPHYRAARASASRGSAAARSTAEGSAESIDPRAGAALLARILLRHHRLLDTARSTLLLERVLDGLGVAT
jgi:molecular chaperone HtpG